jgi:transposase InsO family protein
VKYAFIKRHAKVWPIMVQCDCLGVSASGYRQHFARQKADDRAAGSGKRLSQMALAVHVKAVFHEMKGAYGWPRIWRELSARGIRAGKERVRKLMKDNGLQARGKRRFKVTTDSSHGLPVSPNLLQRQFDVALPNRVWTGDVTYIWTAEGWVYLAVVIDLYSRQIVGFAMDATMTRQLVIDALRMAWFRRKPASGLIFHSDRGSQYASGDFQSQLTAFGMQGSMSRKGDCWDNAVTETLFGSLKVERLHDMRFTTRRAAKDEVMNWILFYNSKRLHSTLGYISPMDYERKRLGGKEQIAA